MASSKTSKGNLAQLTPEDTPTVAAIYAAWKAKPTRRSRRIGASTIGGPCDRAIWYSFRWAGQADFSGRMLRLFDTGNHEEKRIIADLKSIGCEVDAPEEQHEFTGVNGHLVCKIDGAVKGLPEAPETWHVLEVKTHNIKSFAALKSKGLDSKPTHRAQCATAMLLSGMNRCLYIAVCKDTDELWSMRLRIEEERELAESMIRRAEYIRDQSTPPEKISDDPEYFECKWCDHKAVCHGTRLMDPTCRSCCYSTPVQAGGWICEHGSRRSSLIGEATQLEGCEHHRFIPLTIGYAEVQDSGEDEAGPWVEYKTKDGAIFRNGPGPHGYSSKELATFPPELVGADTKILGTVADIKARIGSVTGKAEVVKVVAETDL